MYEVFFLSCSKNVTVAYFYRLYRMAQTHGRWPMSVRKLPLLLPVTSISTNRLANVFTRRLSDKFAVKSSLKVPAYVNSVATLPCELCDNFSTQWPMFRFCAPPCVFYIFVVYHCFKLRLTACNKRTWWWWWWWWYWSRIAMADSAEKPHVVCVSMNCVSLYIKLGKVRTSVTVGVASSVANDVTMRMTSQW